MTWLPHRLGLEADGGGGQQLLAPSALHSEESLFLNSVLCLCFCFFWMKWAGYLAVAGLNLLGQISDRISHFGV